jgi:hypothetical protein
MSQQQPPTVRPATSSSNGRFLTATSEALLYIVAVAVCLVALASFALSFNALAELAVASHIPAFIGWAWPVVVDASIIIATFASLVLRGRSSRAVRAYPWVILIVFGAVSVAGNGYHALTGGAGPVPAVAFAVGAVPAVALLASTHLLVVMLTSPHQVETDEEFARRVERERRAALRQQTPAEEQPVPATAGTASASPVAKPAPAKRSTAAKSSRAKVEKWIEEQFTQTGKWPTGPAVGDMLGLSRKSGARVVAEVRERVEAAAAAADGQ